MKKLRGDMLLAGANRRAFFTGFALQRLHDLRASDYD